MSEGFIKTDSLNFRMRKLMEEVEEKLYNELRLLVEERDRAIHGLEITKSSDEDLYSSQTAYYQTVQFYTHRTVLTAMK